MSQRSLILIQTSPGRGLGFGIFGFPPINLLACREEEIIGEFHLLPLHREFLKASRNCSAFQFTEFGQLGHDFGCAQLRRLTRKVL